MAVKILKNHFTFPLEREFEAWTTLGISNYFKELGIKADIFAVSPLKEKTWPSDEELQFHEEGKVVGLQFKRPNLDTKEDYSDLYWSLYNPPGQYDLVKKHDEIFYALPTFVNRKWQERALDHCIFWRPKEIDTSRKIWYDRPNTKISLISRDDSWRWGLFIEQIMQCHIGQRISNSNTNVAYKSLKEYFQNLNDEINSIDRDKSISEKYDKVYYFIFIPSNLLNK